MPCYHPLLAWKTANGEVVFVERQRHDTVKELSLPCGRCIGCKLERSRQWAMRCMHEASLHKQNCFITLTYRDEDLPDRSQLEYAPFQRFMKRLRKAYAPDHVGFYMCGEYGSHTWRPHFHACLFNCDFPDKRLISSSDQIKLYTSPTLERLWPYGLSSIGALTFESAAYVARYCVQKRTGSISQFWYARTDAKGPYLLNPEFNHMSLKPGIGRDFANKWFKDIYTFDQVIVNGHACAPPKYYDKILKRIDVERFEEIAYERELDARGRYLDNTPERLAVKEEVAQARNALKNRSLN